METSCWATQELILYLEKLGPALRNRFKDLIIIFPAVAKVVEVLCNSVGPGSANAFDQVLQFRKDIVHQL